MRAVVGRYDFTSRFRIGVSDLLHRSCSSWEFGENTVKYWKTHFSGITIEYFVIRSIHLEIYTCTCSGISADKFISELYQITML